jgi:hypothetical protein
MNEPNEHRSCRWICWSIFLSGLAAAVELSRFISVAIDKVASGHGLDTYHTFWLVEFNYIGVLVLFAAIVLALLVAGGMRLFDWWQWRSLAQKYGHRNGNS